MATARVSPRLAGRLALELWRRPGRPAWSRPDERRRARGGPGRRRPARRPLRGHLRLGRRDAPGAAGARVERPGLTLRRAGDGARGRRLQPGLLRRLGPRRDPGTGADDPGPPAGDHRARRTARRLRGRGRALVRRAGGDVRRARGRPHRPGRGAQRDGRLRPPRRLLLRHARAPRPGRRAAAPCDRAPLLRRRPRHLGAVLGRAGPRRRRPGDAQPGGPDGRPSAGRPARGRAGRPGDPVETPGLGHSRILDDPEVIDATVRFLEGRP